MRRITYDMSSYLRGCVEKYAKCTGIDVASLPHVKTPFLDEEALRARHNIGHMEFKLEEPPKPKKDSSRNHKKIGKRQLVEGSECVAAATEYLRVCCNQ